ncbi:uncharacterized protein N7518_004208 [Penicillium psychrosexuale]|uniref:uncharacterized protein n=1 Tax=Penicillium psychrosexuale TaxID=1002107 RepID=UPI002545A038|nr:uncharacterized protein N7518_004208 [Penicillium psychrosexuale]KAJ5795668.1 hypothetical protein N7518_004208 [Penicillium psychrosexuale]
MALFLPPWQSQLPNKIDISLPRCSIDTVHSHSSFLTQASGHFILLSEARQNYKLGANNTPGTTALQLNSGISVAPGNYMVLDLTRAPITIELTTNYAPRRVRTQDTGTQDTDFQSQGRSEWSRLQTKFRNSLRQRDGCCAITGQNRASSFKDPFRGLDATHVFPVSSIQEWRRDGYQQYITDPLPSTEIGQSRIYSAQNGLLLSADIHSLFDSFELGIDPDVRLFVYDILSANYKIIVFGPDHTGIGGTRLRDSARSGTWRVSADLLRWHLRMCLYNNLKTNAEPQTVWEEDLGEDSMGEILSQPDVAERMEVELFTRLGELIA